MSLKHRVGRLEAKAPRTTSRSCASCGVPAGWHPIFDVVDGDSRSLLNACDACGHAVGDNGRALHSVPPGRGQKQFGSNVDWRAV